MLLTSYGKEERGNNLNKYNTDLLNTIKNDFPKKSYVYTHWEGL